MRPPQLAAATNESAVKRWVLSLLWLSVKVAFNFLIFDILI